LKNSDNEVEQELAEKKISRNSIAWNDIGVAVSSVFGKAYGCSTV
jgi:hypothetical protein